MKIFTTEKFIINAKDVHGNKYDYSKTIFIKNNQKVIIICPKHGEFEQIPNNHSSGQGCPKCGRIKQSKSRKLTTEEFIVKSKKIHGDKYDYSKVNYDMSKYNVTIVCPEHGEFEQQPSNHLNGKGCGKCSKTFMNLDYFIEESKKIHGDKYDYSKVVYIGNKDKVVIICPEHGDFTQTPSKHLNSQGCPKCKGKTKTTEEFVEQLKQIHGVKYDYSKVVYIDTQTKITVICPEHGEFSLKAKDHYRGIGCTKCKGGIKFTTEEYVKKSKEVHGDKYDYSKVIYKNTRSKVIIICPEHGEFETIARNHYIGTGCPLCNYKSKYYISYDECKKIVKQLNLKSKNQYIKWWLENKNYCLNIGIPKYPETSYLGSKRTVISN